MAETTTQSIPIPIGTNGQLVKGNLVTNKNGDAEWYQVGASYPTFTSNKSNDYKWQPSENCFDFLGSVTCPTDSQKQQFYSKTKSQTLLNQSRYNTFISPTGFNSPELAQQLKVPNPSSNVDPNVTGTDQSSPKSETSEKFEDIVDQTGNFKKLDFSKISQYFTYPESMNDGQDRILFTQYKYVATKISTDLESTVESFANRNEDLKKEQLGTVTLPIPNQISETNQTGWGESSLTTIGAMAMGGLAEAGIDLANFNGEGFNKAKNLAGQLLTSPVVNRAQSFLAAKFASQIISKIGVTVDPEAYINRVTGAAINPNMELLFNGPKLRPFSFSFKMTARSKEEAKNIRAIIKFFKAGMAPQRSKKSDASLYLGAPNVFQVEYKSSGTKDTPRGGKDLDGIGRIKMCALQSCAINYTPDGAYAAYDDNLVGSQPIAIEMQLQLIEITPVFADEYNLEDDNVPIGPEGSGNFVIEPESNTQ